MVLGQDAERTPRTPRSRATTPCLSTTERPDGRRSNMQFFHKLLEGFQHRVAQEYSINQIGLLVIAV